MGQALSQSRGVVPLPDGPAECPSPEAPRAHGACPGRQAGIQQSRALAPNCPVAETPLGSMNVVSPRRGAARSLRGGEGLRSGVWAEPSEVWLCGGDRPCHSGPCRDGAGVGQAPSPSAPGSAQGCCLLSSGFPPWPGWMGTWPQAWPRLRALLPTQ